VEYKIKELIQEGKTTRTFRLVPLEGKIINFKPGQFVMLTAEIKVEKDNKLVKRAYSISSSPQETYMDLTIRKVPKGLMSNYVMELKKGDIMNIEGPYGRFIFEKKMKEIVLIAGGFGVMPFRCMVNYIRDKKLNTKITLIVSERHPNDTVFREEFEKLKTKSKNFNYFITYTRVEKNPEYGFVGRLDKKKLSKMIKDFKTPYYFSCGSLGFIKSVKDILLKQGANKEKIEVEGY
jgi:ferredoxin-NADP reductase